MDGCGKRLVEKAILVIAQFRKQDVKVNAYVRRAAHASCIVLNAFNPFANTYLVVRQVKAALMMSQLRENLWSLKV